ncbi:ABC transporter substrate-binding protein [Rhizobium sp. P28RR-XV]|uniref:ABC transporter substrate-binding protein n=1 Tax=Rhizobium sp. P28RR-XV TaxID=2726737 RepID=UPI0014563929|nr:ABC transporter substrate-binding protein [Rhizobium sp. P28RR-XV]NLR88197.1 ABC transporter substrate-binding protein [Rhizobium sp. P28RR-XV]
MKKILSMAAVFAMLPFAVFAQEPIKIGFISTFSGPQGVLGTELSDGFKLGLRHTQQKLGSRDVEIVYGDDQAKPDIGRQLADKMIESDRVQIVTGINFSNVLLAVAKPVLDAGAFYVSVNAGPHQYAGKQCHPHFFAASFQNDQTNEAIGIHMQNLKLDDVYIMAPNYPAGKDMLTGFKRYFKGKISGEVYTAFGQLDYAAEIAQIRAAKPKAVMFFYPGGMGINFVKQYAQAGLKDQIPLFVGSHVIDQTVLPAIGEAAVGVQAAALWSESLDNPASKRFASDFEKEYKRIPSPYAALAYDTVLMLDAALTSIGGKIEDKAAFRKAMEDVKFESIRGSFRFNKNHFPIQNAYLTEIAKDSAGRFVNAYRGVIATNLQDAYAGECNMPTE